MAQLTIIGLGTVGSSIGLAMHRYMQSPEGATAQITIVGHDPTVDLNAAQKGGIIDRGAVDLATAVRESRFIILALPTRRMRAMLESLAPHLVAGTTVTDTAPNKRVVLQWAGELLPEGVSFIGGHPLPRRMPAPTITVDAVVDEPPDADLFAGAPYCIMPAASATEAAVNQVISLAEALGAKPFFTDPYEHDSFQAAIHDLPLLSSFALMRVLSSSPSWRDISPLAGAAFREATRMASGDPASAHADLVANRENLIGWIDRYQAALQELRDLVVASNPSDLHSGAGKDLAAALVAGRDARTHWINPQAAPTPDERAAQEKARDLQSLGVMRNLFGGFLTGRLGPDRPSEPDRKDRK